VLVAFLALQAFIDLTGELPKVGKNGYSDPVCLPVRAGAGAGPRV
jgi:hypothetical protein